MANPTGINQYAKGGNKHLGGGARKIVTLAKVKSTLKSANAAFKAQAGGGRRVKRGDYAAFTISSHYRPK